MKDAVADAAVAVAGRAGVQSQAAQVQRAGAAVAGAAGRAYDPLLEHLIGRTVVVTLDTNADLHEYAGVFREYSGAFLATVDVALTEEHDPRTADLMLPRGRAVVRYAAEAG